MKLKYVSVDGEPLDIYLNIDESETIDDILIKLNSITDKYNINVIMSSNTFRKIIKCEIEICYKCSYTFVRYENVNIIFSDTDNIKDNEIFVAIKERYKPIRVIFE